MYIEGGSQHFTHFDRKNNKQVPFKSNEGIACSIQTMVEVPITNQCSITNQ